MDVVSINLDILESAPRICTSSVTKSNSLVSIDWASVDRYLDICEWARERYREPDGTLVISKGGEPSKYSRITDCAWDRYMKNVINR